MFDEDAGWGSWEVMGLVNTCKGFPLYRWRERERESEEEMDEGGRCSTVSKLFVKTEEYKYTYRWIVLY